MGLSLPTRLKEALYRGVYGTTPLNYGREQILSWVRREMASASDGALVRIFFRLPRSPREGNFLRVLDPRFYVTPYYRGPSPRVCPP